MKRWLPILFVYLGLALVLVQMHNTVVNERRPEARGQRHARILEGRGEAPWAYRVLVPAAAEAVAIPLRSRGIDDDTAREAGYLGWRLVFTFTLFVLFHRFLETWLDPPWAFAGTAVLAALHGPSYLNYWFQPASALDIVLWTAAALLTRSRRDLWLWPIVILGAFNRETIVFAIGVHACLRFGREPVWRLALRCLGLAAAAGAVLLGLRLFIPVSGWARGLTVWDYTRENLTYPSWLAYAIAFVGPFVVLTAVGFRRLPRDLKLLTALMVPYVALIVLFGRIREVRLFLPTLLALLPASLLAIRDRLRAS